MIKGQDIAILIKILIKQNANEEIEFKWIAFELFISQSEVSKGILRLEQSNLIKRQSDNNLEINKQNLIELLIHGLKYFFPKEINITTRGIATAYSPPLIRQYMLHEEAYVWPYSDGKNKGLALTPIYKTLANALARQPDEHFYKIMSAIDLIRLGGNRENKIAKEIIDAYVWYQQDAIPALTSTSG